MPEMKFGGMAEVAQGKIGLGGVQHTLGKKLKQTQNQSQLDGDQDDLRKTNDLNGNMSISISNFLDDFLLDQA